MLAAAGHPRRYLPLLRDISPDTARDTRQRERPPGFSTSHDGKDLKTVKYNLMN
jgi:hypothetical protein